MCQLCGLSAIAFVCVQVQNRKLKMTLMLLTNMDFSTCPIDTALSVKATTFDQRSTTFRVAFFDFTIKINSN